MWIHTKHSVVEELLLLLKLKELLLELELLNVRNAEPCLEQRLHLLLLLLLLLHKQSLHLVLMLLLLLGASPSVGSRQRDEGMRSGPPKL